MIQFWFSVSVEHQYRVNCLYMENPIQDPGNSDNRRNLNRFLTIVAVSLLLFKFQNCAPNPGATQLTESPDGIDSEVRIVDRYKNADIAFLSSETPVANTATEALNVRGLCVGADDNEIINWEVTDSPNAIQAVVAGSSVCKFGQFELALQELTFSACNESLTLRAQLGNHPGEFSETKLVLHCE